MTTNKHPLQKDWQCALTIIKALTYSEGIEISSNNYCPISQEKLDRLQHKETRNRPNATMDPKNYIGIEERS